MEFDVYAQSKSRSGFAVLCRDSDLLLCSLQKATVLWATGLTHVMVIQPGMSFGGPQFHAHCEAQQAHHVGALAGLVAAEREADAVVVCSLVGVGVVFLFFF